MHGTHGPRRQQRGRILVSGLATGALILGAAPAAGLMASAAGDDTASATPEPRTGAMPATTGATTGEDAAAITLITGDTVYYADSGGAMPSIDVQLDPDSGTRDVFVRTGPDGVYVIPDQAQPLIDADVVDPELFDVQYLAENGYTDAEVDALPVIVTYESPQAGSRTAAGAAPPAARASELPAVESQPVELASINGAGIGVDKDSADQFWAHLRGSVPGASAEPLAGRDSAAAGDGIAKVWLDGKVTPLLDDSRPQIGVPTAWEHGVDGSGATVAVLDTGYDPTHPDLADQVVDSASFVPGIEDARDLDGHGTHVASTIAGTGAASDGRYAGVAPGADLVVGKVLSEGFGMDSWIIAGMEWAASKADVVNMSLGGYFPSDGTDPLSTALNQLTADTDTLFVVSAGNSGPNATTISSPAAADAALTVAAVDSDDQVADFSSRGPRRNDHALKPEIAAPGNPVVAAWAAGTDPRPGVPIGPDYVAHAGTSMSSPHVAGVAAMLAQRHPEWNAQQLKDGLMSTSLDIGADVYAAGAGRVDAARVATQDLYATGKADFAFLAQDAGVQTRTITYVNTGDDDLTLDLAVDVDGPSGAPAEQSLTVSDETIVVPAHGEASVDLTLDPSLSEPGAYSGHVRAGVGDTQVITAVGYRIDGPTYELTITATSRLGDTPYDGIVILQDLNDVTRYYHSSGLDASGRVVFEVPAGDYAIHGNVRTRDKARSNVLYSTDVYAMTILDVDADRTVTIDARQATDIEFDVTTENRTTEPMQITQNIYRIDGEGQRSGLSGLGQRLDTTAAYGVIPAEAPPVGDLTMTTMTTLREPLFRARVAGENSDLFVVTPERTGRFEGTHDLELVDLGLGTAEDYEGVDVTGKLVLVESADYYVQDQAQLAADHGATALLAIPQAPGTVSAAVSSANELPVLATSFDDGVRLRGRLAEGPVTISVTGVRESSFTYTLRGTENGDIPADVTYTFDRSDLARVENTFHSEAPRRGSDGLSAFEEWEGGAFTYLLFLEQPSKRTDYVAAGPGIRQRHSVSSLWGISPAHLNGADTDYRPGQRMEVSWFKAPHHPTVHTVLPCDFCRSDVVFRFAPRTYGDSDPNHYGSGRVGTSYTLYRDGEQIDRSELFLVPEPATYRIDQVAEARSDDFHFLADRSQTSWTFRSEAPTELEIDGCREVLPSANACAAFPVILLGYDLPLSVENTAPAGRPFHFEVRTDRPVGYSGKAQVTGAKAWLSFDDGATWEETKTLLRPRRDGFRVLGHHPDIADTTGFVSMRVEVWDDAGNRTTQTIERAYALTPKP